MPQIPAMIVSALATVGIKTTTAVVSTWLVTQAVGIGMSILTMALTPKPRAEGGGITTQGTQAGADRPRKFILGRYASAGSLLAERYVYDIDKDDRKYLTQIIAVSDTPIDGYEYFILGDEEFTLQEQQSGHYDDQLGRRPNSEHYGRHTFFKLHNGKQTAADSMLVSLLGDYPERPINANFKFTNIAYMIVTAKYSEKDPTFSGVPQPIAVVRGKPLYDPRKDSTNGFGSGTHRWGNEATYEFSDNPIIMAYNILRGINLGGNQFWGAGATAENLPLSYWVAAANACDEAGSQTGTNWKQDIKRYRAGIEISVDEQPIEVVKELFKSCGASYGISSGQYLVSVGGPSAPVAHFTDNDIDYDSASEFVVTDGLDSRFNAISASYPSIPSKWNAETAEEYRNDTWLAEDGGKYLPVNLSFNCVPWPQQVRRLMRETLKDSRRIRQHTIVLPNTYIGLNPTDTITWTSATNGYTSKRFEVVNVIVNPMNLSVQVGLRERDPADYNYDVISDNVLPFVPSGKSVNPLINGVADFTVTADFIADQNGRARRSAIRLNWSTEITYSRIAYQVRFASNGNAAIDGTISDTTTGMFKISDGILPNIEYQVRAKAIIPGYSNIEWSPWLNVTTGDYRIIADDIDAEIIDNVNDLLEWVNEDGSNLVQDVIDLNDKINEEIGIVQGQIVQANTDLNNYRITVNQLIANSIVESKGYTDTVANTQTIALNTAKDALAAEISQLRAALVGDNLIQNGDFTARVTNDADYWTESSVTIVDKNTASTDTLIATMPKDAAVHMATGANVSVTQRIENINYVNGDSLGFRFQVGALGTVARQIEVRIRWYNAANVEITPAFTQSYTIEAGGLWRPVGDTPSIPANVVHADFRIRHSSASGNRILLTNVSVKVTNTEVVAMIDEVKAAYVNLNSAFVTYQSNVAAEFGNTVGYIDQKTDVLSNGMVQITQRTDNLESKANTQSVQINSMQTAITTATNAIAAQEEFLTAKFGQAELIPDGSFTRVDSTRWEGGTLNVIEAKSTTQTGDMTDNMPTAFALSIPVGTTYQERRTRLIPVGPSDTLDLSVCVNRDTTGVTPRIAINFYDNDKVLIATPKPRLAITGIGKWFYFNQEITNVPDNAAYLRFYIARNPNDPGTTRALVTNISLKRRQGFEQQTMAEIGSLKITAANTEVALADIRNTMNVQFNDLSNTVTTQANSLNNVYTKAQADSAIAAAINISSVSLTNKIGQKANANTVSSLISRVDEVEGNVSTYQQDLRSLEANVEIVTATANGKGKIIRGSTAPVAADRNVNNLWIDTTDGENVYKVWKPAKSAWEAAPDKVAADALNGLTSKADVSVTDSLTSKINTVGNNLSANVTSLNKLRSTVDNSTATGRLKITADANPTTAHTRIGISAAANSEAGASQAAIFVTAKNGVSEVSMVANKINFVTTTANSAEKTTPFKIRGNKVTMTGAFIDDLSITRGKIGEGAITGWVQSYSAKAVKSSKTSDVVLATVKLSKPNKQPLEVTFSATYTTGATIYLQRRIGTGAWTTLKIINDMTKSQVGSSNTGTFRYHLSRSGDDHKLVDKTTATGPISYRLMGRTYGIESNNFGGGGSESSWISYTTRATGNFTNRYIGVFVAYK